MFTTVTTGTLNFEPIAGHLGAEIHGLDLTHPLDTDHLEAIRRALHCHGVLFITGQPIDHSTHVRFARAFGEPTPADPHQPGAVPDHPEILVIDPSVDEDRYGQGYEERYRRRRHTYHAGWHIDNMPTINPPAASILRADVVPAFGGDTHWTNLVAAYDGLSAPLQRLADDLWVEHRYLAGFQMLDHDTEVAAILNMTGGTPYISVHPLVISIPDTGQRALFLSPSTACRVLDVTTAECHTLLDMFTTHAVREEYRCRFRWRPGSLAFWSNRSTAHLAALDHAHLSDQTRRLYRISLVGDVPVNIHGQPSRAVAGPRLTAVDAP